jgi:hypothetical protein
MQNQQYQVKVTEFIHNNNHTPLNEEHTPKYRWKIIYTVNQRKDTIPKKPKHRYYNPNPAPPMIRVLIKVHKNLVTIWEIIN